MMTLEARRSIKSITLLAEAREPMKNVHTKHRNRKNVHNKYIKRVSFHHYKRLIDRLFQIRDYYFNGLSESYFY